MYKNIYTKWKLGKITALHKKGNTAHVGNYRPVSLTCHRQMDGDYNKKSHNKSYDSTKFIQQQTDLSVVNKHHYNYLKY